MKKLIVILFAVALIFPATSEAGAIRYAAKKSYQGAKFVGKEVAPPVAYQSYRGAKFVAKQSFKALKAFVKLAY